MTREEAKNRMVERVTEVQGAKATVLAADEQLMPIYRQFDGPQLFEELVKEGRLVEVEHILPDMNFRCKSFYLPKGTKVRVIGQEKE